MAAKVEAAALKKCKHRRGRRPWLQPKSAGCQEGLCSRPYGNTAILFYFINLLVISTAPPLPLGMDNTDSPSSSSSSESRSSSELQVFLELELALLEARP